MKLVLGVCSLGLVAWVLGLATGPASGQVKAPKAAKVTTVTVTAGKPTEFGFKLSKVSALPVGKVVFKVTNLGALTHDFKVCNVAVKAAKANSCTGVFTRMLKKGQSANLTVVFKKAGQYEFMCTVPGHAPSGMKGLLGVGVKVTPAATAQVATPSSARAGLGVRATIWPNLDLTFSPEAIKRSTVVIKVENRSSQPHKFSINGVVSQNVRPHAVVALTVTFKRRGTYTATLADCGYPPVCIGGDPDLGPIGYIKVT